MNNKHIILLHGWGGTRESLEGLDKYLSNNTDFVIHRTEMPGHGSTPQMQKAWRMKDFSDWLSEYIKEERIKDYVLIGHSFGGKLILEGVINGSLKPSRIVLIDANGIKPLNSIKKLFFRTLAKILKPISSVFLRGKLRYYFYRFVVGEVDYAKTSKKLKESFKLFNEENYDEKLGLVTIPTLIVWGKNDKVTPLWMGKKMNQNIKNSKMIVMEGTHGLPRKNPSVVGKYISEFLND